MELLGYDIRLCPEDYLGNIWRSDVRNTLLLKPDIDCPLTVDNALWPTFFRYIDAMTPHAMQKGETLFSKTLNYRHEKLWLWQSFSEMIAYFKGNVSNAKGMAICVCLYTSTDPRGYKFWDYVLSSELKGCEMPDDWIFLGFDVADASRGRKSGLVNCGYTDRDKSILTTSWVQRLNEFGLFQTLDDALEYTSITDLRVPSHAPFYVYGLFRHPDIVSVD